MGVWTRFTYKVQLKNNVPPEDFLILCETYDPECKSNPQKKCDDYQKNPGWCDVRSASAGKYLQEYYAPGTIEFDFSKIGDKYSFYKPCPPDKVKLNISTYVECSDTESCDPDQRIYFWRVSQGGH